MTMVDWRHKGKASIMPAQREISSVYVIKEADISDSASPLNFLLPSIDGLRGVYHQPQDANTAVNTLRNW